MQKNNFAPPLDLFKYDGIISDIEEYRVYISLYRQIYKNSYIEEYKQSFFSRKKIIVEAPTNIRELILAEIYHKIERPQGEIIKERVWYYQGWNSGNIQRGCVTIFSRLFNEEDQLYKTHIYTYHIRVYTKKIHIYHTKTINEEPDLIIKIK